MLRQIYTITATQVITSDTHPEGVMSTLPDFPKSVDSRNYNATEANPNGDPDTALVVAQAEFADAVKVLTVANNPNRVMWCVTITQANGLQVARKVWGAMPDMTPAEDMTPAPEAEPVETEVETEAE